MMAVSSFSSGTSRVRAGAALIGAAAVIGGFTGVATSTFAPGLAEAGTAGFYAGGAWLTACHLMVLLGAVALVGSGTAATGKLATVGSVGVLAGLAAQTAAEAILRVDLNAGNNLFSAAAPLMAAGFIVFGAAVIRARRWTGWHPLTPLACGLYVPIVLLPSFAIAKGPSFLALAAWQILFVLLAASMWLESGSRMETSEA
jgi:hypothetical protein